MALEFSICEVRWERYRRVSENPHAREWLKFQAARGLAANTIEAYGRDLDRYLGFLETENILFHSPIVRRSEPTFEASLSSRFRGFRERGWKQEALSRTPLCNSTSQWFASFMTS
jgi:site-specific recombinase XerD